MKKLLFPLLLCSPALLFAQSKDGSFIKKYLFAKISPTAFIPEGGNISPATFGTIGVKIHKYAAVGITGGYLKYNQEEKSLIPIGLDFTLTNFKAQKLAPIITAQVCKPANYEKNEKDHWSTDLPFPATEQHYDNYWKTTARSLVSVAAGFTMPLGGNKLAFTAGYSQLAFKTNIILRTHTPSGRGISTSNNTYSNISMANISLSYIF